MTRARLIVLASPAIATSFLIAIAFVSSAAAQGVLVDIRPGHVVGLPRPMPLPHPAPVPPSQYKIESVEVNAKLADQVARVQVSQTFKNTGSATLEACFVFPLPYDGAVDKLTLLVDGKEYEARLLSKDEARRRYEEIVRKNRDPALLEWVGTGMFQTSVFPIPAGAKRTVTLRYSQICRSNFGLTDFLFPLSTAKYTSGPLDKLSIRATIESGVPIKNLYSAVHEVQIERPDAKRAIVTYEAKDIVPTEDFRLFFDTGDERAQASAISYRPSDNEDGYFLLLASPEIKPHDDAQLAKTVVFVIDRSGSMSGEKIDQAQEAARFVLNNLREGDLFNIIAYDSEVETFRPELQKFDEQSRGAALAFVDGLYAGGSTNIDGALSRALGMLNDSDQPSYVLFLTDGLPTTGETGEMKIVAHTEQENEVRARVFAFGVGYDVNSRLLDRIARANHGLSQYVRPNEDIEASVSALYRKIGAPVMTDVAVKFDIEDASADETRALNRVYPKGKFDLFAGDQVVLVGRYRKGGAAKITLTGRIGAQEPTFDFPAKLVDQSDDDTNAFVARLWATRRVGEIIDEIDLKGSNEELVRELVALATEHGILTPYTSFLADETSSFREIAENISTVDKNVESLAETTGRDAFVQRGAKLSFQSALQAPSDGSLAARAAGGYGGRGRPSAAPPQTPADANSLGRTGNVYYYDAQSDRSMPAQNIRRLGRKTFFQRGQQWIDSSVTEEDEQNAIQIERYSPEFFALAKQYGKHVNQYLALDEPVVVKLDGKTYAW